MGGGVTAGATAGAPPTGAAAGGVKKIVNGFAAIYLTPTSKNSPRMIKLLDVEAKCLSIASIYKQFSF
jgi:hypothetical protein